MSEINVVVNLWTLLNKARDSAVEGPAFCVIRFWRKNVAMDPNKISEFVLFVFLKRFIARPNFLRLEMLSFKLKDSVEIKLNMLTFIELL